MNRAEMTKRFSAKAIREEADRIYKTLTVLQICRLTDEAIERFPAWMPKKRLRMRGRVELVKGVIYGKLSRFEKII